MGENTKTRKISLSKLDIVGIILVAIFLPIIILNVTFVIKGATNPDEVPMVFGRAPLIVVSDSMDLELGRPGAFNKNDLIIIKKVDVEDLKENDIISYMNEYDEIITHRIIRKEEVKGIKYFVTKGDFSASEDDPITYDQVIGIYVNRIPKLGGVAKFLQTSIGVFVLLGTPILIFLIIDFVIKNKEKKINESKTAELEAEVQRLRKLQEKNEE